jgi:hypothetical protein
MEDNSKHTNHFYLGDLKIIIVLVVIVMVLGGFFVGRGLYRGDTLAIITITALVVLTLVGLGVGMTLLVLNHAYKHEERRAKAIAEQEQARFVDNARENIALMAGMQRVQNQQNAMLLKQARESTRLLPSPNGGNVDAGFTFDDALFDDMDEE